VKKHLTEDEIRQILQNHSSEDKTEAEQERLHSPDRCRHCRSILSPVIVRGMIRYSCFDCDEATAPL
jgi:hypothetical protein